MDLGPIGRAGCYLVAPTEYEDLVWVPKYFSHRLARAPIGLEVSRGTIAKAGGAFVSSLAERSRAFAVQVIELRVHKLIEKGDQRRRRWMDLRDCANPTGAQ